MLVLNILELLKVSNIFGLDFSESLFHILYFFIERFVILFNTQQFLFSPFFLFSVFFFLLLLYFEFFLQLFDLFKFIFVFIFWSIVRKNFLQTFKFLLEDSFLFLLIFQLILFVFQLLLKFSIIFFIFSISIHNPLLNDRRPIDSNSPHIALLLNRSNSRRIHGHFTFQHLLESINFILIFSQKGILWIFINLRFILNIFSTICISKGTQCFIIVVVGW